MPKTRLVYLCDWLPPDFGAVGQYSLNFARERAQRGIAVALYGLSSAENSTNVEHYPSADLKVVRIKTSKYDRSNFRQRAWWTLVTNLRLLCYAFRDMLGAKEILFTGSPPYLLHFIAPLNLVLQKTLTYRITDFHPECLMAEYPIVPLPLRWLYRLTVFWRKKVNQFEALGEDQRRRLQDIGIPADRIFLRRDPCPVQIHTDTLPLPRPDVLRGHRILLYSGNFGVAHDLQTFFEAYKRHHQAGNAGVALWLNATGARADELARMLTAQQLIFYRSSPVPLEQFASLLVTPEAHLITLRNPFVGYVLPSKVYGCIASGKDILYIGPRHSDVHLLCTQMSGRAQYWQVDVGDTDTVFGALERLGMTPSAMSED